MPQMNSSSWLMISLKFVIMLLIIMLSLNFSNFLSLKSNINMKYLLFFNTI